MGNLDPTAEEFRPTNPNHRPPPPTLLFSPPPSPHSQPYIFPYAPAPVVQLQIATFFEPVEVPCPQFCPPSTAAAALSTSPTRSLLLSLVPFETAVGESALIRELEAFGDVRGAQMEGLYEGMVMATVHFYDLRHAEAAFTAIRWHHMHYYTRLRNHHYYHALVPPPPPTACVVAAGSVVWAQYIVPGCDDVGDGQNEGTIVVFNLDSKVDADSLREIFEAFGPVKELRHTPFKKNQRFVEYFDLRDAAKALKQMNGKEIHGKPVVIEFSRPGRGHCRNFKPPPSELPNKLWPRCAPDDDDDDDDATSPSHCSHMKSTVTKGSHHGKTTANPAAGSTEPAAMAAASVNLGEEFVGNNGIGVEERHFQRPPKRNFVEKHCRESMVGGTKLQQQQPARNRHRKGKQEKKHETRFLIKEDATVKSDGCIDSRTTVMIKNIPNKYSQKLLLNMLDTHCNHCNEQIGVGNDQSLSSYDFVYLPIDFNNKCNVGYGFVNMTSPEATLRLYKAFHLQLWEVFNSRKICEVTYARVQGLEALKEHFKNSKFPYEMEHYLPVMFSPPRDGRQLTEPFAIVGDHKHNKHQLTTSMNKITTIPIGVGPSDDLLCSGSSRSSQHGGVEGDDDSTTTTGRTCSSELSRLSE